MSTFWNWYNNIYRSIFLKILPVWLFAEISKFNEAFPRITFLQTWYIHLLFFSFIIKRKGSYTKEIKDSHNKRIVLKYWCFKVLDTKPISVFALNAKNKGACKARHENALSNSWIFNLKTFTETLNLFFYFTSVILKFWTIYVEAKSNMYLPV